LPELTAIRALPAANDLSLEESEHQAILRALQRSGGVQKEAARLLGISRRAIHYKVKKYGIDIASLKAGTASPLRPE
jgi:DNA-binding NtrC family response regulator